MEVLAFFALLGDRKIMEKKLCRKEFVKYVTLNVLGMIGVSCYILADTFFVANGLGADGLTALNLAIPVYSLVHGSGLMFGVGGTTRYSILRGQKKQKSADEIVTNTVFFAIALAVVYVLCGIFLSEKITMILGADDSVFQLTNTYIRVILLFAPTFMLNDVFLCLVRNDGNPGLSMAAMLIGSFSNIVLDYIFIFSLQMGIFGAVLATGLAPVISMMVLSLHLKRKERFHLLRMKVSIRLCGKCIVLGIPSLITEVASGIVMIVFNLIILKLEGNMGVAAYGVVANLSLVVVSIYTGVAQGMQPLISRAYGDKDARCIKRFLCYAMVTILVLSVVIYFCIFVYADFIVQIFNSESDQQLQEMAETGLRMYFSAVAFIGFNVILSMYFSATEKSLPAQVISLLRGFILMIPMAVLLSKIAGLTGVWLTVAVTEGLVAGVGILLYGKYRTAIVQGSAKG